VFYFLFLELDIYVKKEVIDSFSAFRPCFFRRTFVNGLAKIRKKVDNLLSFFLFFEEKIVFAARNAFGGLASGC